MMILMEILQIIRFFIVIGLERTCFLTHWMNPLLIKLHLLPCLPAQLAFNLDRWWGLKMCGGYIRWFSEKHLEDLKEID